MSEKVMSASEKKKEDWMNSKWRPMMGWMYMAVCMADFVLFPVLWSMVQAVHGGSVQTQWTPITLQGAGLFHMARGAIIGVTAFGRTQEKLNGANNGGINASTSFSPVTSTASPTGFAPVPVASTMPSTGVVYSATGKAMPEQPPMPVL